MATTPRATVRRSTARISRFLITRNVAAAFGLVALTSLGTGFWIAKAVQTPVQQVAVQQPAVSLPQPVPAPQAAPSVDGCTTINGNRICGAGVGQLQQLAAGGKLRNFQEVQNNSHRESGACTPGETKWDPTRQVWRTCFAR